jgi:ketosteroid isomerase-like protein
MSWTYKAARPTKPGPLDAPIPGSVERNFLMLPNKPEKWPRLFEQHFNASDLDAVMALYESDARVLSPSGETLAGWDTIRKVLGAMIDAKTRLHSRVVRTVTVGDIAQLYTDYEGTTFDSSKKTVTVRNKAIEVLRRQPNGDWKLIIGNPNARESHQP